MASTRSTPSKVKPQSGTSKPPVSSIVLPKLLAYPQPIPFGPHSEISNIYSYIIRHYGTTGLSVLVARNTAKDDVAVVCGDWLGNHLDISAKTELAGIAREFVTTQLQQLLQMMHLTKVPQAQFFFAVDREGIMLVDMQVSLNKFAGPGMVRDIFGKIYRTQEVLKIEVINDRALEYLELGTGSYEGDLIIKPTRFRNSHDVKSNVYRPLYVEVKR